MVGRYTPPYSYIYLILVYVVRLTQRASTVATTCTARAAPSASVATGATVNVQPVAVAVGGAGIGHLAESGRTVQGC